MPAAKTAAKKTPPARKPAAKKPVAAKPAAAQSAALVNKVSKPPVAQTAMAKRAPAKRLRWPGPLADMPSDQRNFTLALIASLLIHAVVLSIHFKLPEAIAKVTDSALDIVLVNSRHKDRPVNAQARAQANLDGGGNTDQDRIAATPLPASEQVREGNDISEAQRRVQQLEEEQRRLMTRLRGDRALPSDAHRNEAQSPQQPKFSGYDLVDRALAIARLEGQIEKQLDDYNKRPKKKFIGARTQEYLPAQYLEDWRQKVERIGNLNYPEEARGRFYGSLTVYIEINSEGEMIRSEVTRSSGKKVLDEAALRILRLAAQGGFGRFPAQLKEQSDILAFARVWSFTQGDQMTDKAAK